MKRVIHTAYTLATLLILSLSMPSAAHAGQQINNPGYCGVFGGQAYCWGSMSDIRSQTTDPNRSAQIQEYNYAGGDVELTFAMEYNNTYYTCVAPASMNNIWDRLINPDVSWEIVYNVSTGVCDEAFAVSDSSRM